MAGAVRRVGVAEVPPREPRPEPSQNGSRLRRHLLLASLRPDDAARGDARGARHGRPLGQGALRRDLVVHGRADPGGRRDHARARNAPADPPAVLLDAQPVDRGRSAGRARGRGDRLHRLLAARPGHADGQVPRRDPGRLAGEPRNDALAGPARRRDPRQGARARRDRRRARSDACTARDLVGAPRRAGHVGTRRGLERRAARGERRRARRARAARTRSSPPSTGTRPRATSTSGRRRRSAEATVAR